MTNRPFEVIEKSIYDKLAAENERLRGYLSGGTRSLQQAEINRLKRVLGEIEACGKCETCSALAKSALKLDSDTESNKESK